MVAIPKGVIHYHSHCYIVTVIIVIVCITVHHYYCYQFIEHVTRVVGRRGSEGPPAHAYITILL